MSIAFLLAAVLRIVPVLRAAFPLNDGGLFYLMTRELQHAHFVLPAFTAYNGAHLPFGYPPLAFYIAGALSSVTGRPVLDVVRVLPAVFSVLAVGAFALLAFALLRDSVERVAAVFAFVLLPRTFTWFIMGGGLTRAPGFFFALLTIHQAYLFYTRGEWRYAVTTALAGSLAVVTHIENAWFAAYSATLLFAFYGRHRRGLIGSVAVAVAVLVLTAPWWGHVVAAHGWQPFVSAAEAAGYSGNPLATEYKTLQITDETYLPLLAVLGLLGFFASVASRDLFVPLWLALVFVVNPRNPATPATVPLALLVGVAINRLLVSAFRHIDPAGAKAGEVPARTTPRLAGVSWPVASLVALLAVLTGYTLLSARSGVRNGPTARMLSSADTAAMHWVAVSTPANSRFVVLSLEPGWFGIDPVSEWFPALGERQSVATVQAYEWLPGRVFQRRTAADGGLRRCQSQDIMCVERWAVDWQQPFTHVYVKKDASSRLVLASLRAAPDYRQLFENAAAAVFVRRVPSASAERATVLDRTVLRGRASHGERVATDRPSRNDT